MALDNNRYKFDSGKADGARLRNALTSLESGRDALFREIDTMESCLTGDINIPASYANITVNYGFGSDEYSQAAYFELLSMRSKLNTDAQVSSVLSALNQAFTRLR